MHHKLKVDSANFREKMGYRAMFSLSRFRLYVQIPSIALTVLTLLFMINTSYASDNKTDATSPYHHLSWTFNKTRHDFVFATEGKLPNILALETDANNYLTRTLVGCRNHSACLFRSGKLEDYLDISLTHKEPTLRGHRSVYVSKRRLDENSLRSNECDQNGFKIVHYCSTHWNPPMYLYKDRCGHTIEWHSPLSCHIDSTNYERPCYIYDPNGNLIDLTPWIRSDGSSYSVNTTVVKNRDAKNSRKLKGFFINVCNESYDMCGPNVAACYMDSEQRGLVEVGYNNLTSIRYDAKENNTILLTTQGHFNENCENSRVRTVIRFVCKKKVTNEIVEPKLMRSDACTSVIEWATIHACPQSEIRAPLLPNCTIRYDHLGSDIDVKRIIKDKTTIEVPNIEGPNKSMLLGLCRPLPKELNCEGRQTSSTSACLIDSSDKSVIKTANNSKIVGSVTKSSLRFADDRLNLELPATNRTCSISVNSTLRSLNVTRQIGVRVEFFCAREEQSMPKYLGLFECNYVFEWGSPIMCFETMAPSANKSTLIRTTDNSTSNLVKPDIHGAAFTTAIPKTKATTSDDIARMIATDRHREAVNDATKINEAIVHHDEHQHQGPLPTSKPNANVPATKATISAGQQNSSISNNKSEPTKLEPSKMNVMQKIFMIGLVVVTLVGFLVIILVLDKKTRLRIPLGSTRRHAFQTQSVPYSRVVDDLDL